MRAKATARNEQQNPADKGITPAELTGKNNKPMPGSKKEEPAVDKIADEILAGKMTSKKEENLEDVDSLVDEILKGGKKSKG